MIARPTINNRTTGAAPMNDLWSVIACEPQSEKRLGEVLERAGYDAFVPTYVAWRGRFSTWSRITRPLVPGYVFAVIPESDCYAFKADGVIRMLPTTIRQAEEVTAIVGIWREAVESGEFDEPEPRTVRKRIRASRNRKARRMAGEAHRRRMGFFEGLQTVLAEIEDEPKPQIASAA